MLLRYRAGKNYLEILDLRRPRAIHVHLFFFYLSRPSPLSLSRFPFTLLPSISLYITVHPSSLPLLHPLLFHLHFSLLLLRILPSIVFAPSPHSSSLFPFLFIFLYLYIFRPILQHLSFIFASYSTPSTSPLVTDHRPLRSFISRDLQASHNILIAITLSFTCMFCVSISLSHLLFTPSVLKLTLSVAPLPFVIARIINLREIRTVLACCISTFNHLTSVNHDANINTISRRPSSMLLNFL